MRWGSVGGEREEQEKTLLARNPAMLNPKPCVVFSCYRYRPLDLNSFFQFALGFRSHENRLGPPLGSCSNFNWRTKASAS